MPNTTQLPLTYSLLIIVAIVTVIHAIIPRVGVAVEVIVTTLLAAVDGTIATVHATLNGTLGIVIIDIDLAVGQTFGDRVVPTAGVVTARLDVSALLGTGAVGTLASVACLLTVGVAPGVRAGEVTA